MSEVLILYNGLALVAAGIFFGLLASAIIHAIFNE